MKTKSTKHISYISLRTDLLFLCFILFPIACFPQFQIVGMQVNTNSGWQKSNQAHLTILEPGKQAYTGNVVIDYAKKYPSGTTFTTHANTSISVFYKGQTQIMHPNSTLKVIVDNSGIKAQTLKGTVQHALNDVKNKVGFYRAGNGYTWAHAEGTQFTVEAAGNKSKAVRISTSEGRVIITDEVPVSINQAAVTQGGGREGHRDLKAVVRTSHTAGQQYTTGSNAQPIRYATYEEAIMAFEREVIKLEATGMAYYEELADSYTLIGELYLDLGWFDNAISPLNKAVEYTNLADPDDILILDSILYLAEAYLNSSDNINRNTGYNITTELINGLIPELNSYIEQYNYANQMQDEDWAWDLCYDLVDINEYLGWSYMLLNNIDKANEFYVWADTYKSRL
ncbi:tetratricopeptide repeat protein [Winogradskyella alexanderae]|uniref:Tetratricopeptide repeat protein n=1 Tax=Winogradskyella alexanderae TaxID=2877123 RepID=A0ABS7XQ48_9FLAO|nr:tetratricopeptide repeat protein [Winogradskyella alexanderae]MCA0132130.1 tetratricopeptide repeat protein [Winogradskyella alexanderae]